jgi:hypothetical protein
VARHTPVANSYAFLLALRANVVHSLSTDAQNEQAHAEVAAVEQPRTSEPSARTYSLAEVERIVACLEPLACAVDDGEDLEVDALFERIRALLAD